MQAMTGQPKPILLFLIHSEAYNQSPILLALKTIIVLAPN